MVVVPRTSFNSASRCMISRPVSASRAPVGSSASTILGVSHERAGDRNALPLPARELVGPVFCPRREPDPLQHGACAAPDFRARNAAIDQRESDVLPRVEARQQMERLEHETDARVARSGDVVVGHRADLAALQHVASPRRAVQESDDVHEGRLPRAGRSHDCSEIAAFDPEVHPAQHVRRDRTGAVAPVNVDELQHLLPRPGFCRRHGTSTWSPGAMPLRISTASMVVTPVVTSTVRTAPDAASRTPTRGPPAERSTAEIGITSASSFS